MFAYVLYQMVNKLFESPFLTQIFLKEYMTMIRDSYSIKNWEKGEKFKQ